MAKAPTSTKSQVIAQLASITGREAGAVLAFVEDLPDDRFTRTFQDPEQALGYWAQKAGGIGSGGAASSEGVASVLAQLKDLQMLVQQDVLPRLQKLEISESSHASSSSQSGKNYIDRKQKQCKEAARKLYGVQSQYCQVTARRWEQPDIVSCSHIISRGWHKQNPIDYEKAGLKHEWDPRGTLFFIKSFEQEYDRGSICLVWSGLDDKGLDSYKVKVLDQSLLDTPLSSTPGGDGITFRQVDGKGIDFLNDGRPSKRAVNLHASWAYKKASERAPASNAATLDDISELPESVWSGQSWKQYVEEWLATAE